MAPIRAMLGHEPTKAAIDVAFFILMVGGFLGVVNATGTLDVGIASIVKKYKGREKMLILILMPLFALGGTTYGMGEETMAFYPLLVPVMMAVGFDSITAVAIILLGSQVGCLASTLNPFATVIASDTAGVSSMGRCHSPDYFLDCDDGYEYLPSFTAMQKEFKKILQNHSFILKEKKTSNISKSLTMMMLHLS